MADSDIHIRILRYLRQKEKPQTISAISKAVGISTSNGHYHTKKMVDCGLLLPVEFSDMTLFTGQPFLMVADVEVYLDSVLFPLLEIIISKSKLEGVEEPAFAIKEGMQDLLLLWLDRDLEDCVACLRPDLISGKEPCNGKKKKPCSVLGEGIEGAPAERLKTIKEILSASV